MSIEVPIYGDLKTMPVPADHPEVYNDVGYFRIYKFIVIIIIYA